MDLANEQGAAVLAIKAMSMGAWPQGAKRTRKWWYRTTETQTEVDLALRFVWSQKGVISAVPPSWLDLLDKAIEAGRAIRPVSEAETLKLQEMAKDCKALFRRDEERVALGHRDAGPTYPDSPHECCRHRNA